MALIYLKDGVPTNLKDPEKLKTRVMQVSGTAAEVAKTINRGQLQVNLTSGLIRSVAASNILAILDEPQDVPTESSES